MASSSIFQQTILVATLGSQPQVVTAALDLLLIKGVSIDKLYVIHTKSSDDDLMLSVDVVKAAVQDPPYEGRIPARFFPIVDLDGRPLEDVATQEDAEAAFRTLYHIIHDLKKEHHRIHLSIAGGRKTMSIFGMVTAQLLFEEGDQLWHLYSAGDFLEDGRLHPSRENDIAQLIPIPVVQWSEISPILLDIKNTEDPFQALETQQKLRLTERLAKSKTFVDETLSTDEKRIVKRLVMLGQSYPQIADILLLSEEDVKQLIASACKKAASHWKIEKVTPANLIVLLNLYYTTQENSPPSEPSSSVPDWLIMDP